MKKNILFINLLIAGLISSSSLAGSEIKESSTVVFFPSAAHFNHAKNSWEATIHGHVFEKKENSVLRKLFIRQLQSHFEIPEESFNSAIFKERVRWFLIDDEKRKDIKITIFNLNFIMKKTAGNGHFLTDISIPASSIPESALNSGKAEFRMIMHDTDGMPFKGIIYFVKDDGIILVSDIDDTIKISDVKNKKELMLNTFARPFSPVAGMNRLYSRLGSSNDILFCYVSASPWQLYSVLHSFVNDSLFPNGIFKFKYFSAKNSDFFNLFMSPDRYKVESIEPLLKQYPGRKFILVGDSGEKDPEAYGALARRYPSQIKKILIRKAYPENIDQRMEKAFTGIDKVKWIIFEDPDSIGTDILND